MNSQPKISVITVCFNSAGTIERTLASVASQTWNAIEHIVIDGCSTDGTLDIAKRFDSTVSKLVSEPDNGIYDAMNKGLRLATGEIICFLNSDDFYNAEDVLEKVAAEFSARNLDALIGDVSFFKANSPYKNYATISIVSLYTRTIGVGVDARPSLPLLA